MNEDYCKTLRKDFIEIRILQIIILILLIFIGTSNPTFVELIKALLK
jgi:hypothetical protein